MHLGFFLSGHPLDAYADQLSEEGATTFSLLEERAKEKPSRGLVAGMVVSMRELSGSRGKFGIVKLSDRVGGFEVAVFSEVWEKSRSLVRPGEVLFMMVQVEDDEGRLRVRAESLRNAEQQARKSSQRIEINIDKSTCIKDLRQLLEPGRCEIFLRLHCMKNLCDATYQLPGSFAMNMRTRQAIAALHGVRSVEER
jgi:DNA polymerase III, alpha subunit